MESFRENAAFLFGYEKMEIIFSDKRQSVCPINTMDDKKITSCKTFADCCKNCEICKILAEIIFFWQYSC